MNADDAIIRGQRAKAIIEDPLVVETLASMEADIIARWRRRDPDNPTTPEERDALWLVLQNLDDFRSMFRRYIHAGQMAAARATEREAARKGEPAEP